jgi:hypothetical protein
MLLLLKSVMFSLRSDAKAVKMTPEGIETIQNNDNRARPKLRDRTVNRLHVNKALTGMGGPHKWRR